MKSVKQEWKRQPNLAAACIETVQEAAKWLYHLAYESLLAMTAMCSSKSSSDHGRIRTETKSSWFCMVGPGVFIHWTGGLDWSGLDWSGVEWTHPKNGKMPFSV